MLVSNFIIKMGITLSLGFICNYASSSLYTHVCDDDNDEACILIYFQTETFWSLLFDLLYFCKYGSVDEVALKAKSELSTGL